jgi:hypothetical protein
MVHRPRFVAFMITGIPIVSFGCSIAAFHSTAISPRARIAFPFNHNPSTGLGVSDEKVFRSR